MYLHIMIQATTHDIFPLDHANENLAHIYIYTYIYIYIQIKHALRAGTGLWNYIAEREQRIILCRIIFRNHTTEI